MHGLNRQMPDAIALDEQSYSSTFGRFLVQPLERGFATTLGNTFRRVLLSSIPGAAISHIKIDGVLQEFASIEGVTEDVADVILNLKQVQLKLLSKRPERMSLSVTGPCTLTAADIQKASPEIEVMNPDLHLATLGPKATIQMDLEVCRGYGYVPSEDHDVSDQPIGTIPIDCLFSPVTNVTFRVENTRVGHKTDYERLVLEVQTDGTVTPDDALTYAARVVQEHVNLFINFDMNAEEEPEEEIDEAILNIRKLLMKSVDDLELSVRSSNCLEEAKIETVGQLVSHTEAQMLQFKNFGKKSLNELNAVLKTNGLEFGMEIERYLGTPAKEK